MEKIEKKLQKVRLNLCWWCKNRAIARLQILYHDKVTNQFWNMHNPTSEQGVYNQYVEEPVSTTTQTSIIIVIILFIHY